MCIRDSGHGCARISYRWNAPEITLNRIVTNKSDVWSFGILLYEMITQGRIPYEGIEEGNIRGLLEKGYRLPCPLGCEDALYKIMLDCWRWDHEERPEFSLLLVALQNLSSECIL